MSVAGFSEVKEADQRLQLVAEQVCGKLEDATGKKFDSYQALTYCDRYNDMMKEDCIKIKVSPDQAIIVYVEEAAIMIFPPQVNLLSYIPNVSCDAQLAQYIEELMSLRK